MRSCVWYVKEWEGVNPPCVYEIQIIVDYYDYYQNKIWLIFWGLVSNLCWLSPDICNNMSLLLLYTLHLWWICTAVTVDVTSVSIPRFTSAHDHDVIDQDFTRTFGTFYTFLTSRKWYEQHTQPIKPPYFFHFGNFSSQLYISAQDELRHGSFSNSCNFCCENWWNCKQIGDDESS